MPRGKRKSGAITGKLKPADPFELIRWLARSQSDPRKALAELVQNSLDASARQVQITRVRERGVTTLHVRDDGNGVLPELSRQDALGYIATNIGHSRKANLTPEQRRELMLQGKYGIGLLGFWSIGRHFEMRTQLDGSEPWVLRLTEDEPNYEIERLRTRLPLGGTWTEIVIRQLHRPAFFSLAGRRIADYLAAELRGQLLARPVRLTVHDRVARGRAPKVLEVEPLRYPGQRMPLPESVDTGLGPLRVDLYLLPERGSEPGRVTVSCGGTIVYDDLCEFGLTDFRHPPWTDGRLTGILEFAAFDVAPGSRRGILPNAAAAAFTDAAIRLEEPIRQQLREEGQRLAAQVEADTVKQLQRAFRDLPRLAPEYDFFAVRSAAQGVQDGSGAGDASQPGLGEPPPVSGEEPQTVGRDGDGDEPEAELFPVGPLSTVDVAPRAVKLPVGGERRLRARARATDGRTVTDDVTYRWASLDRGLGIEAEGRFAIVHTTDSANIGDELSVVVEAQQSEYTTKAEATIGIVAEGAETPASLSGVPEPAMLNEPTGNWRSRFHAGRWEVNAGHRDYLIAAETPRRKLRYLTSLLAKEIVLHSFPNPQHGGLLERLVEVLTIAERRLG